MNAVSLPTETLSLKEAAAMLGIGIESMRGLILDGAIPAVSLNHKHMVLLRADVIAFVRDTARRQQEARIRQKDACAEVAARSRRKVPPSLAAYATKVARPARNRAGSHSASASSDHDAP